VNALNAAGQNRTHAAKILGISRRTMQNKIKEYDL
jgi:DNA-binding protein Fis